MAKTKYYKVLNGDKAKDGGNFDYKQYLPKGKKPGKWLPKISDLHICKRGYHVTKDYTKWLYQGTVVYEVEGKGTRIIEDSGDKVCFETIRFIKLVETNKGNDNMGLCNSGNWNSGDRNSGDWNSGNRNSGNRNSGNRNSGDCNSGNWNSGNRNSGDCNLGNWNSGNRNSGNWNSGNRNSGNRNSGNWNSGDWNSGYLNTNQPKIRIFNKRTNCNNISFPDYFYFSLCIWIKVEDMSDKDKKGYWWYKTTNGYLRTIGYKEAWKISFDKATKEDVTKTLKLPNFNYKLFEKISGITKKMIQDKLKE